MISTLLEHMDRKGKWKLSPAYDVTYSHNPAGAWTNQHQMNINGKRDNFARADILKVGEPINIEKSTEIIEEILDCVKKWPDFAHKAGVKKDSIVEIGQNTSC